MECYYNWVFYCLSYNDLVVYLSSMICNPYICTGWVGKVMVGVGMCRGRSVYVKYSHKKNCTEYVYCWTGRNHHHHHHSHRQRPSYDYLALTDVRLSVVGKLQYYSIPVPCICCSSTVFAVAFNFVLCMHLVWQKYSFALGLTRKPKVNK